MNVHVRVRMNKCVCVPTCVLGCETIIFVFLFGRIIESLHFLSLLTCVTFAFKKTDISSAGYLKRVVLWMKGFHIGYP